MCKARMNDGGYSVNCRCNEASVVVSRDGKEILPLRELSESTASLNFVKRQYNEASQVVKGGHNFSMEALKIYCFHSHLDFDVSTAF